MTEHQPTGGRLSRRSLLGAAGAASLATPLLASAPPARAARSRRSPARRVPRDLRPGGSFDRFLADMAAKDELSGTVLLEQRGRTVLSRSYGMADKQRKIPNGPDTIFATGSVTKLFTALAVTQLAEAGRLRFDDMLGAYVDGFPAEIADTITIHQLLTHTSGMGDFVQTDAFHAGVNAWKSPADVMAGIGAIVRGAKLVFTPGTDKRYSNSGYHALGELVAKVSGRPSYYDYVRERVFRAARMSASDFYTKSQWRADRRIAHPYTKDDSGQRVDRLDQMHVIGFPAGHAHASAPDLARFARALQGADLLGRTYTELHLSPKVAGRWSDSPSMPPQIAFNTYGPQALLIEDQWTLLHNGGAPGVSAYVEMYPAIDLVSVVLSNYDAATASTVAAVVRRTVTKGW